MQLESILSSVSGFLWGVPMTVAIFFVGIYFTIKTGFWQFKHFGHIFKNTIFKRNEKSNESGTITAYAALCTALGGTIGVGNIAGVATAIATGGPGAVFWMWLMALIGMITKMVEITLAVHYKTTLPSGELIGGPTYYIQRGIGMEKKFKYWKPLAIAFGTTMMMNAIFTLQNYTVSESFSNTFNVNMILVSFIFMVLTYVVILGGLKRISAVAVKIVPIMSIFYVLCGLYIVFADLPAAGAGIKLIFTDAFTGTAAIGGFLGASVSEAIKRGLSRGLNSNEAGQGTSPIVHAVAKTKHPINQGMWGSFEVFVDTIIVCTITALMVLTAGGWTSGASGATLVLDSVQSQVGIIARYAVTIAIFIFGWTTIIGFSYYYEVLLKHATSNNEKLLNRVIKIFRYTFPIPAFLMVVLAQTIGLPPNSVWLFVDIAIALPTFINLISIFILRKKFFELLKDYEQKTFIK